MECMDLMNDIGGSKGNSEQPPTGSFMTTLKSEERL